jgi:CRISPR-associated protein Csm4
MALFRAILRLKSPLGTPLHSGTLFGQLCWTKRECDGEAALENWLSDESHVWALSDGFPAGLLPRPLARPAPPSDDPNVADDRKKQRKRGFVRRDGFIKIRHRVSEEALGPHLVATMDRSFTLPHNSIDRRTGSTREAGGLYFLEEDWSFSSRAPGSRGKPFAEGTVEAGPLRDLYIDASESAVAHIKRLLSALGEMGYGRDANLGRGQWTVESVEPDPELANGPHGRLASLSHGSAEPDMSDLRCRIDTHYGRAGPGVTVRDGISPFKKPLLLLQPGATFNGPVSRRYGALLRGVHSERPEIVHNAFHVAIPFVESRA